MMCHALGDKDFKSHVSVQIFIFLIPRNVDIKVPVVVYGKSSDIKKQQTKFS